MQPPLSFYLKNVYYSQEHTLWMKLGGTDEVFTDHEPIWVYILKSL
jgi:hypothetical protein